ncbi:MAG: hypothetical protein JNJ40_18385 [Bacteroidia bacterium]|nr:hypothetical protein [Bacteroidia bacterium]
MKKSIWKSIGAIVAGFLLGAVLSILGDIIFNSIGLMNMEKFTETSTGIIFAIIVYRFTFNVVGCYLTAKLAPNKPMKHALIIGLIGTVLAILGSAAMWDKAVAWYNISVILISFPSAWLGAKLFVLRSPGKKETN